MSEKEIMIDTPFAGQAYEDIAKLIKPWLPALRAEGTLATIKSLLETMELKVRLDQTSRIADLTIPRTNGNG